VWCYLKSGGLMTAAGWVFPDGTRCQTGTSAVRGNFDRSSATLCMAGRCQVKLYFCIPLQTFTVIYCLMSCQTNRNSLAMAIQHINCTKERVEVTNQRNPMSFSITFTDSNRFALQHLALFNSKIQRLHCTHRYLHRLPSTAHLVDLLFYLNPI